MQPACRIVELAERRSLKGEGFLGGGGPAQVQLQPAAGQAPGAAAGRPATGQAPGAAVGRPAGTAVG
jgi:hypothetical protein